MTNKATFRRRPFVFVLFVVVEVVSRMTSKSITASFHINAFTWNPSIPIHQFQRPVSATTVKRTKNNNRPVPFLRHSSKTSTTTSLYLYPRKTINNNILSRSISSSCSSSSSSLQLHSHFWDGDDIRWRSKWLRRMQRSFFEGMNQLPTRNTLILLNICLYIVQTINTLVILKQSFPSYWPQQAFTMIMDSLMGSTTMKGSLTHYWSFHPRFARTEVHRYITSGFLHGGIFHLLFNMDALRRLPDWLETGLGSPLYLSTFLISVVTGNRSHAYWMSPSNDPFQPLTYCLGASGGIMGLYGLMYVCLLRMGNSRAAWSVIRGFLWLLFYGFLVGGNISHAAHLGGFVGGIVMGILFGPRYRSSYAMLRKNSLEVDPYTRDYRSVMGMGKTSTKGLFSLTWFWIITLIWSLSQPTIRNAPLVAFRGLF